MANHSLFDFSFGCVTSVPNEHESLFQFPILFTAIHLLFHISFDLTFTGHSLAFYFLDQFTAIHLLFNSRIQPLHHPTTELPLFFTVALPLLACQRWLLKPLRVLFSFFSLHLVSILSTFSGLMFSDLRPILYTSYLSLFQQLASFLYALQPFTSITHTSDDWSPLKPYLLQTQSYSIFSPRYLLTLWISKPFSRGVKTSPGILNSGQSFLRFLSSFGY